MPGQADNRATSDPVLPAAAGRAIQLSQDLAQAAAWSEQIATHTQPPLGALRFGTRLFRRFDTLSTAGTWGSRFAGRFARGIQRAPGTELTLVARLTAEPDFDDREWDAPWRSFSPAPPAATPPTRPEPRRATTPIARSATTQPARTRPSQATDPQSTAASAPTELPGAPAPPSPADEQSMPATHPATPQPGPIARFAHATASAPRGALPLLRVVRPDPLVRMGLASVSQDADRAMPEPGTAAPPRQRDQPPLQPLRPARAEPAQQGFARWVEQASRPTAAPSLQAGAEVPAGVPTPGVTSSQLDMPRSIAPPAEQPTASQPPAPGRPTPARARSARPLQLMRPPQPGPLARMALASLRASPDARTPPGAARPSPARQDQPLLRPIRPAPGPDDTTPRGIARWAAPPGMPPLAEPISTRPGPEAPPRHTKPHPLLLLRAQTAGPLMRMGLVPAATISAGQPSATGGPSAGAAPQRPLLRPIRPTPDGDPGPGRPRGIARWAEGTIAPAAEAPTQRFNGPTADTRAGPVDRPRAERVSAPPRLPVITAGALPLLRTPAPGPLARMGFAPAPGTAEPAGIAAGQAGSRTPEQPLLRPIRPTPGADSTAAPAVQRGIARWAEPTIAVPEAAEPPIQPRGLVAPVDMPAPAPGHRPPHSPATEAGTPPAPVAPGQGRPLPGLAFRTSAARPLPLLRMPAPGLPARTSLAGAITERAGVAPPQVPQSISTRDQPLLRPIRPAPDAVTTSPAPRAIARWSRRSPAPSAPDAASPLLRPTRPAPAPGATTASPTPRAIARWSQPRSAPVAPGTSAPALPRAAQPPPGEAAAALRAPWATPRPLPLLRTPAPDLLARMGLAPSAARPTSATGAPLSEAGQPLVQPIRPALAPGTQAIGPAPRAIARWSNQAPAQPDTQPSPAPASAESEPVFVGQPAAPVQRPRTLLPASSDRPMPLLRTPAPDPLARWGLASGMTGQASAAGRGSGVSVPPDQPLLRPIRPARAPETTFAGQASRTIARQAERLDNPAGDRPVGQAPSGPARPLPDTAAGLPRETRPALALPGAPTPNVLARMGLAPAASGSDSAIVQRSAGSAQLASDQPLLRPSQPARAPDATPTGAALRAIARWSVRAPTLVASTTSRGEPAASPSSPATARSTTPTTPRRALPLLRTSMPGLPTRMNLASNVTSRIGVLPVPGDVPPRWPTNQPLLRPIRPAPDATTSLAPRGIARWSEPSRPAAPAQQPRPATRSTSMAVPAQWDPGAAAIEGSARLPTPTRSPSAMPGQPLLRAPSAHPLMRMGLAPFADRTRSPAHPLTPMLLMRMGLAPFVDSPPGAGSPGLGAPTAEPPLLRPIRPTPDAAPAAPAAIARWSTSTGTPANLSRAAGSQAVTPTSIPTPVSRSAATHPLPLMRAPAAGPLARLGRVADLLAPASPPSEPDRFTTDARIGQPLVQPIHPGPAASEPISAPVPRGIARWADHPGAPADATGEQSGTTGRDRVTGQVPGSAIGQTPSVEEQPRRPERALPARPRPLQLLRAPIAGPLMRMAPAAYKAPPHTVTHMAPAGPLLRPLRPTAAPGERSVTSGATALMRATDRPPSPIGLGLGAATRPGSVSVDRMHSSQVRLDHPLLHALRPAIGPDAAPMGLTGTPIARRYDQAAQVLDTPSAGAIQPASPSRATPILSQTTAGARGLAYSAAIIARTTMPLLQPIAGIPAPSEANGTAPERVRHSFSNGFGAPPLLQRMARPAGAEADRGMLNHAEATVWPGMPVIGTGAPLLQRAPWTTQAADQPSAVGSTMTDGAPREAAGPSGGMPLIERMPWTLAPQEARGQGSSIGIAARRPISRQIESWPDPIGRRAATATLPATDPAAMDFIQPIRPAIQRVDASVEAEAAPDSETTTETQTTEPGGPDIEALARQVYARLRRRLVVEAERLGR